MNTKRVKLGNSNKYTTGQIVYWMSRDMRVNNNWALLYAQQLAEENGTTFSVVFCLRSKFEHNTARTVDFLLSGLEEVSLALQNLNIPFHFLIGDPVEEMPSFIKNNNIGCLVTDFNPLRWHRTWVTHIAQSISIPLYEVDAHNIVPVWVASPKQEFGAYTLRPKIHAQLSEFLTPYPKVSPQKKEVTLSKHDWKSLHKAIVIDDAVAPVSWFKPGAKAAEKVLENFLETGLAKYKTDRNDPTLQAQSNLSLYLHFGHISSQEVALATAEVRGFQAAKEAFLEELIVRKELSDNFCFYNQNYDNAQGFPDWAKKSHEKHKDDPREYIYTREALELGRSHDELWNSAQMEMVKTGKMHGYMRMYWAKKIMEWTKNVATAQEIAIYLNDRYFLDGRDPNGYTGIAWSMGGVHDRAWFERPIFGKIRYMNYNGAKSKFNIQTYIDQVSRL